jgi:hypothetical protein
MEAADGRQLFLRLSEHINAPEWRPPWVERMDES